MPKRRATQSARTAQPELSEAELNRRHERFMLRWKTAASILKWIIGGITVVGFGFVAIYLPVKASSGQSTVIKQTITFLSDFKMDVVLAWGTAIAGTGYGYYERTLRHKERADRDRRIRELEKRIDPNVTSSGLNASGTSAVESK